MKYIPFGVATRKKQRRLARERQAKNEVLVKQRIVLPSGATLTICRAAGA